MARHIWERTRLRWRTATHHIIKQKIAHTKIQQNFTCRILTLVYYSSISFQINEREPQAKNPTDLTAGTWKRQVAIGLSLILECFKSHLFSSIDLIKNSFSSPFVHLTSGELDRKLSYPLLCSRYCLCASPGATFSKVLVSFGPVWKSFFFYLLRQDRKINRFEIQMWS